MYWYRILLFLERILFAIGKFCNEFVLCTSTLGSETCFVHSDEGRGNLFIAWNSFSHEFNCTWSLIDIILGVECWIGKFNLFELSVLGLGCFETFGAFSLYWLKSVLIWEIASNYVSLLGVGIEASSSFSLEIASITLSLAKTCGTIMCEWRNSAVSYGLGTLVKLEKMV